MRDTLSFERHAIPTPDGLALGMARSPGAGNPVPALMVHAARGASFHLDNACDAGDGMAFGSALGAGCGAGGAGRLALLTMQAVFAYNARLAEGIADPTDLAACWRSLRPTGFASALSLRSCLPLGRVP